jgi:type IX secretion system PorP/SprF family membrane protein
VPFVNGSFNAEYKQPIGHGDDFITTGLQLLYDKAGSTGLTTTNVLPAVNYHKALSGNKSKYLSLGFMGGWVGRSIDRSKIITDNTYTNGSSGETFTNASYNYIDGSVGMSYNSTINDNEENTFFVGLAYHHINRPGNSFYRSTGILLKPKWVASGGVKFGSSENSYITVQADYSRQGNYNEIIGGLLYSYKMGADFDNPDYVLHVGGFMRIKDAFIPVIKLDYHPFAIAISYDVNTSKLTAASHARGGGEISLVYTGFLDRNNSTRNAVLCPRF